MTTSLEQIMTNAASGMSAQSVRMNTIASNLANSGSTGSSEETTYHSKYPIFSEVTQEIAGLSAADQPIGGVRVTEIESSKKPLQRNYDPQNPIADKDGYVYITDVNPIEQMTNMISASKDYQANVEVMNTTTKMIMQSINALSTK